MRKIKFAALVILVITATLPLSSFSISNDVILNERELRAECSYEITGVRECLQKKQRASEVELKRAGEKVREALTKWDEDPKFIKIAKTKFVASEKAFVEYREKQCAFASSLGGGAIGNALEMQRLACIAELNNRRAKQLRDASSDLPLK